MLSAKQCDEIRSFNTLLGDPEVSKTSNALLIHSTLVGPVVTMVGAAGRGKTALTTRLSGYPEQNNGGIALTYGSDWNAGVRELFPEISRRTVLDRRLAGNVLLCDGPSLDSNSSQEKALQVLDRTDLIVYTVQITQPTGYDEVHFAREHVKERLAVLVLTKCDQVDQEDFADAIRAIRDAYGILPWKAIVVSGRNLPEEGVYGLPEFTAWWRTQGIEAAQASRRDRQKALTAEWLSTTSSTLKARAQTLNREIEIAEQALRVDARLEEAYALQKRIRDRAQEMTDQADTLYAAKMPDLHQEIMTCVDATLAQLSRPDQCNLPVLEDQIRMLVDHWDRETKESIQSELRSPVVAISEDFERLTTVVGESGAEGLVESGASMPLTDSLSFTPTLYCSLATDSSGNQAGSVLISGAAGMGGYFATSYAGWLIFGAALGPFAFLAGAVAAWKTYERINASAIERQRAELRATLLEPISRLEVEIRARYREQCQDLCDGIVKQLMPYERRLRQQRRTSLRMLSEDMQTQYHDLSDQQEQIQRLQSNFRDIAQQLTEKIEADERLQLPASY